MIPRLLAWLTYPLFWRSRRAERAEAIAREEAEAAQRRKAEKRASKRMVDKVEAHWNAELERRQSKARIQQAS